MEVTVNYNIGMVDEKDESQKERFLREFGNGYLWAEIQEKEHQLAEYLNEIEFVSKNKKDSFKEQYLDSIVWNLKKEISELKKFFQ
ncbi:MAG: hypothetical protein GF383_00130 [Candidatus Lokiarchaeota archaeon]|nr:hypothetical protein [Candidatus Lokiarchaeota archaeon]MBD3337501.1 hypothetical protein [Candidatus Lokiarchaeota archaeon]